MVMVDVHTECPSKNITCRNKLPAPVSDLQSKFSTGRFLDSVQRQRNVHAKIRDTGHWTRSTSSLVFLQDLEGLFPAISRPAVIVSTASHCG